MSTTITPNTYMAIPRDQRDAVDAWINAKLGPRGFAVTDCIGMVVGRDTTTLNVQICIDGEFPPISDEILSMLRDISEIDQADLHEITKLGDEFKKHRP